MPNVMVLSKYSTSAWYLFGPSRTKAEVPIEQVTSTYSPSTDWEKVFMLGDEVNAQLKLSENDILADFKRFRKENNAKEKGSR